MVTPATLRVAVIPARGGSKRIPRKNVRPLGGRPLIAWAIETCLASALFDDVIVSTDDDEVADIALAAGARVPFTRPASLSDDSTPLVPVMAHALRTLREQGVAAGAACCVYPTAVTLAAEDLDAGWRLLATSEPVPYSVGVVRYGHPIQRALAMDADARLEMAYPDTVATRTQDLPPRWHDAGQFVWGWTDAWIDEVPVLSHAVGVELPAWRVVDLDTEDDWTRAEVIHEVLRSRRLG